MYFFFKSKKVYIIFSRFFSINKVFTPHFKSTWFVGESELQILTMQPYYFNYFEECVFKEATIIYNEDISVVDLSNWTALLESSNIICKEYDSYIYKTLQLYTPLVLESLLSKHARQLTSVAMNYYTGGIKCLLPTENKLEKRIKKSYKYTYRKVSYLIIFSFNNYFTYYTIIDYTYVFDNNILYSCIQNMQYIYLLDKIIYSYTFNDKFFSKLFISSFGFNDYSFVYIIQLYLLDSYASSTSGKFLSNDNLIINSKANLVNKFSPSINKFNKFFFSSKTNSPVIETTYYVFINIFLIYIYMFEKSNILLYWCYFFLSQNYKKKIKYIIKLSKKLLKYRYLITYSVSLSFVKFHFIIFFFKTVKKCIIFFLKNLKNFFSAINKFFLLKPVKNYFFLIYIILAFNIWIYDITLMIFFKNQKILWNHLYMYTLIGKYYFFNKFKNTILFANSLKKLTIFFLKSFCHMYNTQFCITTIYLNTVLMQNFFLKKGTGVFFFKYLVNIINITTSCTHYLIIASLWVYCYSSFFRKYCFFINYVFTDQYNKPLAVNTIKNFYRYSLAWYLILKMVICFPDIYIFLENLYKQSRQSLLFFTLCFKNILTKRILAFTSPTVKDFTYINVTPNNFKFQNFIQYMYCCITGQLYLYISDNVFYYYTANLIKYYSTCIKKNIQSNVTRYKNSKKVIVIDTTINILQRDGLSSKSALRLKFFEFNKNLKSCFKFPDADFTDPGFYKFSKLLLEYSYKNIFASIFILENQELLLKNLNVLSQEYDMHIQHLFNYFTAVTSESITGNKIGSKKKQIFCKWHYNKYNSKFYIKALQLKLITAELCNEHSEILQVTANKQMSNYQYGKFTAFYQRHGIVLYQRVNRISVDSNTSFLLYLNIYNLTTTYPGVFKSVVPSTILPLVFEDDYLLYMVDSIYYLCNYYSIRRMLHNLLIYSIDN